MEQKYFEKTYCDECIDVHFVEVTRAGITICHGGKMPQDSQTHYVKRSGKGFLLIPKANQINYDIFQREQDAETAEELATRYPKFFN